MLEKLWKLGRADAMVNGADEEPNGQQRDRMDQVAGAAGDRGAMAERPTTEVLVVAMRYSYDGVLDEEKSCERAENGREEKNVKKI